MGTHRLDACANFLWGLPLGVLAAAACFWGIRSEVVAPFFSVWIKLLLVCLGFVASVALWCMCYWWVVKPFSKIDIDEHGARTLEEVATDTVYTWWNCNPVYVLKCKY